MQHNSGSIEIDPIDVSNLRRFSIRRNRIGSKRTNVTKTSVWPGFEYTFFALTLNPIGTTVLGDFRLRRGHQPDTRRHMRQSEMVQSNEKTPSLSKPSFPIWSHSLRAWYRLPHEINVNISDRSMEFIGVFHIQFASWRTNKAETLRWDPSDRVLGRFDI